MGGGGLSHIVSGGEIYLNADQLATLFTNVGTRMMAVAAANEDNAGGAAALMMMSMSERLNELRSELLKREIEASFSPDELTELFKIED